jgi:hypothetical protein
VRVIASSLIAHVFLHLGGDPWPALLRVGEVFAETLGRVRDQNEPEVLLLFLGPILATHDGVESEDNEEVLGVVGCADEESNAN